ncbi:hypothetical protein HQ496_04435 [bacterium]|nr:hypothetical protein [bacterium]
MQRTSFYLILAILLTFTHRVNARQLSAIPGAFADIGIGAHVAGQGFTGTASISGAGAVNWNIASIYPADGLEASFSYVDQLGLIDYGHVSIAIPLFSNRNAVAFSAEYSGDEALTEQSVHFGYSHRIAFMWLGLGVGYRSASFGRNTISSSDYHVFSDSDVDEANNRKVYGNASGLNVDLGLLMKLGADVRWGISAKNVTAPLTWKSASQSRPEVSSYVESIPLEISTGVTYQLSDHISGALEWVPDLASSSISRIGFGADFSPVYSISIRAGRMLLQDGYKNEVSTFGFGIRTPRSMDLRLSVDYAYVSSFLATTQHVSLLVGL